MVVNHGRAFKGCVWAPRTTYIWYGVRGVGDGVYFRLLQKRSYSPE